MKLPCPNCRGICRIDIPKIPWDSLQATCQRCSMVFVIKARVDTRPDHREARVYCSNCGNTQAFSDHCTSCKSRFARFMLVQTEKRITGSRANKSDSAIEGKQDSVSRGRTAERFVTWLGSRPRWLTSAIVGLAFLACLTLLVGRMVFHTDSEKEYLTNYVQTVYGINSGIKLSKNIWLRYSTEGVKSFEPATISHIAKGDEKESLDMVKNEIDGLMLKLATHPKTYDVSFHKLQHLYETYKQLNAIVIDSLALPTCKTSDIKVFENEYASRLKDIKQDLPGKLSNQFIISGSKYDLRFFNDL
ncbi:hypothetical protein JN12_00805 [Geobacter argillaceus]|uniref:Zinc finger/thioredoxin putative domain-containing protein n=2 Tax=Geobacter argillaceus TaxID=345631 RepID=A0A562WRF5_9BACT|nr:hypothetical protein JN12_00805 [Geobacter argillaceus]